MAEYKRTVLTTLIIGTLGMALFMWAFGVPKKDAVASTGIRDLLKKIEKNTRPVYDGILIPGCSDPWPGFPWCYDPATETVRNLDTETDSK